MKAAYPVIFTEVETNILIEVPDLKLYTEANEEGAPKGTMADAIMMARDAIGMACINAEDNGEKVPMASSMEAIDIGKGVFFDVGKSILSLVDVDLVAYRRKMDSKMVRRNVTLPNWLNLEAEKAQINVSKVLQEALMTRLGVTR